MLATCNSAIMQWQVSSNYEWKHTVLTGANISVVITVSTFTQTVP